MRGRRWVFTLNNPSTEEIESTKTNLQHDDVRYGIFGREVGASGTPHLQGFIIFKNAKSLRALRQRYGPRGHYELARGTSIQARDYCKKDGSYEEFGDFPNESGRRTDLEELIAWADEFEEEHGRPAESPDVAKEQPQAIVKYPRFTRLCELRSKRVLFPDVEELHGWQDEIFQLLEDNPDDRQVNFVIDTEGGKGKTTLCKLIMNKYPDRTQILTVGKRDDLAFAVKQSCDIFLFNIPRSSIEFLSYSLLEQLKDRLVFCGKYQSKMKVLRKTPHVFVFTNEYPDETKLTDGRIKHIIIN
mgnify:CR=1 FL=1